MERITKNPFYMPEGYPLPFELKRAAIEYQMTANWKKSKQDRELRAKQTKEAKIVAYTSTNVSRKTKNVNRSPRQVRRNERERGRKARLNAAFKVLRNVIPLYSEGLNKEKLTQVQVLRLAAKYIMTLSEILGSEAPGSEDDFYASQFQCSYDMLQYINQSVLKVLPNLVVFALAKNPQMDERNVRKPLAAKYTSPQESTPGH
eukprot:gene8524-14523_t